MIVRAIRGWFWPDTKPTRHEWGLIALLGTAFLVSRYDFSLLSLALPNIQRDLGVSESELGPFIAYARLGAVAALPLAIMADRIGRRRLLLFTILGFSLCSVATAFAQSWSSFAALQFLARAFTAADEMISVVVILEEIATKRRGWAVAILAAFGGLGDGVAAIAYPLSNSLPGGWRALYLIAAVPLLLLLIVRRNLSETKRFDELASTGGTGFAAIRSAIANNRNRFVSLLVVTIAYHLPISATLSLMSKFLQENHSYAPLQVSGLFIGAGAFALIGNLLGGTLSDKIGRRGSFAIFCGMMAVGFSAFYLGPTGLVPWAWTIALFGFLASHAVFLALAGEAFPTVSRATVATFMLAVGAVSTAIGLFVEGWLYSLFQSHGVAVVALTPAFLIAGIAALFLLPETGGTDLTDRSEPHG